MWILFKPNHDSQITWRALVTWSNFLLRIASLAFSAISNAFIFGWTLNVIPLSLGISTYSSNSGLKYPDRFPFQKNVTWPNLTVSLLTKKLCYHVTYYLKRTIGKVTNPRSLKGSSILYRHTLLLPKSNSPHLSCLTTPSATRRTIETLFNQV